MVLAGGLKELKTNMNKHKILNVFLAIGTIALLYAAVMLVINFVRFVN